MARTQARAARSARHQRSLRAGARTGERGLRRRRGRTFSSRLQRPTRGGTGAGGPAMRVNLALLIVLAASLGANFGIRDNPARRNFEVMPEMVHSAAYKSFTANPNFADGKTLQLPPEGTIARGTRAPRPAASAAMVNQGARTYQVYCLPCHG